MFGLIAALVASYKGMNAGGGPKGVGDAVNQSVVITFMLLFVANFVMTAVYFQLVPQKGGLTVWPRHPARQPPARSGFWTISVSSSRST